MLATLATEIAAQPLGAIMFGGDSVARGVTPDIGGYRKPIETAFLGRYSFSFVGPYTTASPGMTYPNYFGQAGQTAQGVLTFGGGVTHYVGLYLPDIFTAAWGINDVTSGRPVPDILVDCDQIVTDAFAVGRPSMAIVQLSIVYTGVAWAAEVAALNAGLHTMATSRGLIWCDVGSPPTSDTIHPTTPGYAQMATIIAPKLLAARGLA